MKERILLSFCFCIFLLTIPIYSQADLPPNFENFKSRNTNFQAFKTSVNQYYREKISNARDSVERKYSKRQLKMWNREFWLSEYYIGDNGQVVDANKYISEAHNRAKREQSQSNNRNQTSNWQLDGPTNTSFTIDGGEGNGRIDRLAFHPTNPNIIYAGSPHGGLFKSTNGGNTWSSISSFLPSLGISGIVIHPTNPNIIYILSGDGDSSSAGLVSKFLYRSDCTGVYKTINGGDTWIKLGEFNADTEPYRGRELIMDPSDSNVLYAATGKGLFKTLDAGITWSRISTNTNNVWDVKLQPGNPQVIYYVNGDKFYRSLNGGTSFNQITITDLIGATRISMAVTPANPNRIILFAGKEIANGDDEFFGIFRSEDGGDLFYKIYDDENLFNNYADLDATAGQVNYNNTITIHPVFQNIVVVGGLSTWASNDGGITWGQATAYWPWTLSTIDYIHPDVHKLAFNSDGALYCANDGGVYKSLDNGGNWEFKSNGLSTTQFYHFEVANDEGDTWGGAQDNGILERESGGVFFHDHGGDGYDMMTDHPYLVADGESDDVYYTVNEGIYKDCAGAFGYCDISIPGNQSFFGNLAMSPLLEDKIFVGYEQAVYISTDAGVNWSNMGGSVPGNWDIATCPSNDTKLYAAGVNNSFAGGIRRRENGSWTGLTSGLYSVGYDSNQKITEIEVHPTDSDKVFISCAGFIENSKVYYTNNGGSTWYNWTFNLPNIPVFSIKRDASGGLYVGTSIGVYYKRNNVNYWEPFSNGLPAVPVTQIELNGPINVMISTFGRGLWNTSPYEATCSNTLTLTTSPDGNYYKEATISISSTKNISETTGTNIKYNAGTRIELKPGFKAPKGTEFRTFLTGCGGEIEY